MKLLVMLDEEKGEIIVPHEQLGESVFFVLTHEEALALNDYFLKRAGYISHEFDQPVIDFNKRLDNYVEKIRFKDAIKEEDQESPEK